MTLRLCMLVCAALAAVALAAPVTEFEFEQATEQVAEQVTDDGSGDDMFEVARRASCPTATTASTQCPGLQTCAVDGYTCVTAGFEVGSWPCEHSQCPPGTAVCGMSVRVADRLAGDGDDIALNGQFFFWF